MEGMLLPVLGVFLGVVCGFVCLMVRRLRGFVLAAGVSPFVASMVFLMGGFILQDMNPAVEYGAAYHPTGKEHVPTGLDYFLWLFAVVAAFGLSFALAYFAQRVAVSVFRRD